MKKLLYYTFVSLLALVLAVLSLASSGTQNAQNNLFDAAVASSATTHIKKITELNDSAAVFSYIVDEAERIENEAPPTHSVEIIKSTQHFGLEDAKRYNNLQADIIQDKTIDNLLVVLKTANTSTNDTLLIVTHYDRAVSSKGAYDSALNVAVMLEAMQHFSQEQNPNQIAFLFTDAYHSGNTGLKKFLDLSDPTLIHQKDKDARHYSKEQSILDSTKLAVVLSGYGSSGAVSLYMTGEADYNTVNLYIKGGGTATTGGSAIKRIFSSYASGDTASLIKESGKNILAFSAFGDRHIPASSLDTYSQATFNTSLLNAVGSNLFCTLKTFSVSTLNLKTEGRVPDATYFSYLGKTVNMGFAPIFIIVALTVLIFAVAIYLKNKDKKLNFYKLLLAASVYSVAILCSLVGAVIVQSFLGLFGGFGAVIKSYYFANKILDIGFIILSLGIMTVSKYFYDRYFKVRFEIGEAEFSAAPAFIILLLAILTTIFLHQLSYMFSILSLLLGINILLKSLIKNKFFAQINIDIIAVALVLPIYIYFAVTMSSIVGAVAATEVVPLFGLLFMFVFHHIKFKNKQSEALQQNTEPVSASIPAKAEDATVMADTVEEGQNDVKSTSEEQTATENNAQDTAATNADTTATATETPTADTTAIDPATADAIPDATPDAPPVASVPNHAPHKKCPLLKTINSLTAGILACIIGFVFILCGGIDTGIRNQLGAKITYQAYSSTLQKEAYTNAVVYTYGQNVIDTYANTEDTTFSYTIMGKDNYNALKKHTKIFTYSKNISTAKAQKIAQPKLPEIYTAYYSPTREEPKDSDDETEIYESIPYHVTFKPTDLNTDYEVVINNIKRLSVLTITEFGEPLIQYNAGDGIFDNKDSIKLVLNGEIKIALHFNNLSEPNFNNLPKPTFIYKELKKDAQIPSALSFLEELNIRFNIIFHYQVSLFPSEIIAG